MVRIFHVKVEFDFNRQLKTKESFLCCVMLSLNRNLQKNPKNSNLANENLTFLRFIALRCSLVFKRFYAITIVISNTNRQHSTNSIFFCNKSLYLTLQIHVQWTFKKSVKIFLDFEFIKFPSFNRFQIEPSIFMIMTMAIQIR